MPGWVVWIVAAAVLAAGEIFTLGFFLGPIALAAVVAAAAATGVFAAAVVLLDRGSVGELLAARPRGGRRGGTA